MSEETTEEMEVTVREIRRLPGSEDFLNSKTNPTYAILPKGISHGRSSPGKTIACPNG